MGVTTLVVVVATNNHTTTLLPMQQICIKVLVLVVNPALMFVTSSSAISDLMLPSGYQFNLNAQTLWRSTFDLVSD